MIERIERPLSESDVRRVKAYIARIDSRITPKAVGIEAMQVGGAAAIAGLAYSFITQSPILFSLTGTVLVAMGLFAILQYEKRRSAAADKRRLQAVLSSGWAQIVRVRAHAYAEFAELADLGPMYAFEVNEGRLFVVRGQDYYATESFPSLDFELIHVPRAFSRIRTFSPKATPAVRYSESAMRELSKIEDGALVHGTATNALESLRNAV